LSFRPLGVKFWPKKIMAFGDKACVSELALLIENHDLV